MKRLEPKPRLYVVALDVTSLFLFPAPSLLGVSSMVEGCYRGEPERCLLLECGDALARRIAQCAGQESYLCIAENDRQCYEVDTGTGYHTALGVLETLDPSEPDPESYFTRDGVRYAARGLRRGVDLPEGL